MELTAVIEGLSALKRPCEVALYLDSQYVRQGITSWITGWKAKGWRTSTGQPVKTSICGNGWTRWWRAAATASPGTGCAAMPVTRATSAPTHWPTAACRAADFFISRWRRSRCEWPGCCYSLQDWAPRWRRRG
jgi:hypothetical protein